MSEFVLVIGNKNYSSWSLRPWLAMKMAGLVFEEIVIPLHQPETATSIARHSPAGKVPVLKHGARVIWESIAILEYLAELLPNEHLWPADIAARAHARVVCAEMHAGFQALRSNLPMYVRASKTGRAMKPEVAKDIARITAIWHDCRARFGSQDPFLFGRFSNADAMWAPVVTRFATYGVTLDDESQIYCRAILALPPMREWYAAARAEPWSIDYDQP
ncbi:MAG: glutathione S-transferase family protein [Rhodospirillales bacterium]